MTKKAGSGSESISQRHGSADPDPQQNVMDPKHHEALLISTISDVHITPALSLFIFSHKISYAILIQALCFFW
jgi:hypothetical protein